MPVHNGLKNGNGCCFVGERYGCWWKDGAIQANEEGGNSNIGDYKAVTCTSTLMRFYQFHEKCSLIPKVLRPYHVLLVDKNQFGVNRINGSDNVPR